MSFRVWLEAEEIFSKEEKQRLPYDTMRAAMEIYSKRVCMTKSVDGWNIQFHSPSCYRNQDKYEIAYYDFANDDNTIVIGEAEDGFFMTLTRTDEENWEPEDEPDLELYVQKKYNSDLDDQPHGGAVYLTKDGKIISGGSAKTRQDHRFAVPSLSAMKRWGWSAETISDVTKGNQHKSLMELIRRSGLLRIGYFADGMMINFETKLTEAQKSAIRMVAPRLKWLRFVSFTNGFEREVDSSQVEEVLGQI